MQFIADVIKNIKNPFIVIDEAGYKTLKWLDKWTEDGYGYKFKCQINDKGELIHVAKSDFWQTDHRRAYFVWKPYIKKEATFRKPELDAYIYQENYKKWEAELERTYRNLGINEKDVRMQFISDEEMIQNLEAQNKTTYLASVYLINMVGTNFYKIGIAKNTKERIKQLQTGNPLPLEVKYESRVIDAFGFEQELHQQFNTERVLNEWFELSENRLKEAMEAMKTMRFSA